MGAYNKGVNQSMWYLAFDTATQYMSVAISNGNSVVAEYTSSSRKDHSSRLMPAVEMVMKEAGIVPTDLRGIIVGKGPGSYTGLRIGVSTAKSLAWSLNIPLVGASSLSLMARGAKHYNGYVVPFMDARRGQVYTGLYGMIDGVWTSIEEDRLVLMKDWLQILQKVNKPLFFVSHDMEMYKEMIEQSYCVSGTDSLACGIYQLSNISDSYGRAGELVELGIQLLNNHQHGDAKSFAPEYLRLAEAEYNWLQQQKTANE